MALAVELTTVADDFAVFHSDADVYRYDDLSSDTDYEFHGVSFRTLVRPQGELLSRITTVNDIHFGETECGVVDDRTDGPIVRPEPGEGEYPEFMNRAAVAEMLAIDPDVVVVKGDLSCDGTLSEWETFESCYREPIGDRLRVVRGNHDAYHGQTRYSGDQWIEVDGLAVGLLDTVKPTQTPGTLRADQITELDDRLTGADRPILLMGHHQQWIPNPEGDGHRSDDYFGIDPDASDLLDEVCVKHSSVIGYAAGHTHRHRVRPMTLSGIPSIEVGCVKDFPGTWAEYRIYEGGVMQVVHRISTPDALSWSNRCRALYSDFGIDYQAYALGSLAERCFVFPERGA